MSYNERPYNIELLNKTSMSTRLFKVCVDVGGTIQAVIYINHISSDLTRPVWSQSHEVHHFHQVFKFIRAFMLKLMILEIIVSKSTKMVLLCHPSRNLPSWMIGMIWCWIVEDVLNTTSSRQQSTVNAVISLVIQLCQYTDTWHTGTKRRERTFIT